MTVGLYGGVFDPPHNGHLALAETALAHFDLEQLFVLVVASPGHKDVELDVDKRAALARLAFGGIARTEVVVDPHPRTVDSLRERGYDDPLFLIGADEFADFASWKDPNEVLELARMGVATRPGYPLERLDRVLLELDRPDRVHFFEIPAIPISSKEIRARIRRGESVADVVPQPVAREIESGGLYR